MTIGVTGAFGFLGATCISELLANPISPYQQIVAFGASRFSSPLFDSSLVQIKPLDILDRTSLADTFSGIDILVHSAGKVGFAAQEKRAVWDANVLGALNVFHAAQESGVQKIINISSVSALGPAPAMPASEPKNCVRTPAAADAQPDYQKWHYRGHFFRPLTEDDRPYDDPGSPWRFQSRDEALDAVRRSCAGDYSFLHRIVCIYLDSKLANLELAHQLFEDTGVPIVNILPGTAIGRGEAHTGIGELIRALASGRLKAVLPGACSFMTSHDFARGVRQALRFGKSGQDYILAGAPENNLSFSQLARMVPRHYEAKRSAVANSQDNSNLIKELPCIPARAAGYLAERMLPGLNLSEGTVLSGCVKAPCSSAKAIQELGYDPSSPLQPAILDLLE